MSTTSQPPRIACPHCQGKIKAPSLAPGSQVTCPKCGKAFVLGEVRSQRSEVRGQETGDTGQEAVSPQSAIRNPQLPGHSPAPAPPAKPLPRAHSGTRGVAEPPPGQA